MKTLACSSRLFCTTACSKDFFLSFHNEWYTWKKLSAESAGPWIGILDFSFWLISH